jgi:tetratricopeptide (TPR) repeat protein
MSQGKSDRNLLFGVLALQMDFITRDALLAAMHAWVLEKGKPLGRILVERGDLDEQDFALLEPLVAKHVERHGGDPERSLESLTSVSWLRQDLLEIHDPELSATATRLGAAPDGTVDPRDTATLSVGAASLAGQRFRVLRHHASGGLGEVFVARDGELNREVALKQIKGGYADHPESRSRFLLEAEVTGALEHPGVVPVYGLGHYPDGRPFYAMRFIRGDSLKEAIERFHRADSQPSRNPGERALALRQLLRRFVDVCNTVAYAHSRGVLHRDLKPGNVMLGPYGETLVVDWGLAKPIGHAEGAVVTPEGTLHPSSGSRLTPTQMGSAVGTPAFMSPEQAAGRLDVLGPASDVYSLGAMLYSLLTGRAPCTDADLGVVLRKVQTGEFPLPRQVNRTVPPALEATCLKAMAREPGSRYPSPKALADEIEHWLADEPVTAWREPPSVRARRWAWRHRSVMIGATAAVLAGLIGLAAVAAVQSQSNRALRKANGATFRALDAEKAAKNGMESALAQSEKARKQGAAVLAFLKNDVLAAAQPEGDPGGLGKDVTLRQAIDIAERKIAASFQDHSTVEAELRATLGYSYLSLGAVPRAISQLERAVELYLTSLGPQDAETVTSSMFLADAYQNAGRAGEAVVLFRKVLTFVEAKFGPVSSRALTGRYGLATCLRAIGREEEASAAIEPIFAMRDEILMSDQPDSLSSRDILALSYYFAKRYPEAIRVLDQTLKESEAKLGPHHLRTLVRRRNLGAAYTAGGRHADAVTLLEGTIKLCEVKLGNAHPHTIASRSILANAYCTLGRTTDAIELLETTIKLGEPQLGADYPMIRACRAQVVQLYARAGHIAKLIGQLEALLATDSAKLGPAHPYTLMSRTQLAGALSSAGRYAEAAALHGENVKLGEAKLGPDDPQTLRSRSYFAADTANLGFLDRAVTLLEPTLGAQRSKLGPDHPDTRYSRDSLTVVYEALGRWAEAEPLRRDGLFRRRKVEPPDSPLLAADLAQIGTNLLKQSKWYDAEPLLRESLAIREKALPDDWSRFNTMSLLGGELVGRERYAEAEPLVAEGYKGMKARDARIPPPDKFRVTEAAERVIRLFEAWGKPDKAAEWKVKLGLADLPSDVFAGP